MKKQDLKTGMAVKTRNDTVWLVINDLIVCQDGYMYLAGYSECLVRGNGNADYDIVDVYEVKAWGRGFNMFDMDSLDNPRIFRRLEPPRMADNLYKMRFYSDEYRNENYTDSLFVLKFDKKEYDPIDVSSFVNDLHDDWLNDESLQTSYEHFDNFVKNKLKVKFTNIVLEYEDEHGYFIL